jgi:ribose transport system substrate-binding protein
MKKLLFVLSVLLVFTMVMGGCAPKPTETAAPEKKCLIGISNSFVGSEWRAQMITGMQLAADELGCTLIIESADTDVNGQIQQINNLINQGVTAIVINPGDVAGLKPTLEEAIASGIVVVAVDQEIDIPGGYNVAIDQKKWAMLSAEWLFGERLGGTGNVTLLEGFVGHPANEARMAGVDEVLAKYPNIKVVLRDTGMWDPATAQQKTSDFLASGQKIDGMWTQDGMAEGMLLAIKAANLEQWPQVAGEARASYLRLWKATIAERPDFVTVGVINPPAVGNGGVRAAYLLLKGRTPDPAKLSGPFGNTFYVPIPDIVTNDNLDSWLAKIEGKSDSYTLDAEVNQALIESYFLP